MAPWHVEDDNPDCSGYAVVKDAGGEVEGCHETKADAEKQLAALYANEEAAMPDDKTRTEIRAASAAPTVADGSGRPRIAGHFARFNTFNEIESATEGRFLERIEPGAFKKTLAEGGSRIRMLFQHGRDPHIGDKPIGAPDVLREDRIGPYFEGDLFESVPPLVVDGLRAGQYGISYRFSVVNEDWNYPDVKTDVNPQKLPERTIREARVYEFGPVTFPADPGADYAVRAITLPDLDAAFAPPEQTEALPADGAAAEPHSDEGSRETVASTIDTAPPPKEKSVSDNLTIDEKRARDREITDELTRIANEFTGVLPPDEQARWDSLTGEQDRLRADITAWETRQARVELAAQKPPNVVPVVPPYSPPTVSVVRRMSESDVYGGGWAAETSPERRDQALRDYAMRSLEQASFPWVKPDEARDDIARLLDHKDSADKQLARRILATGSPVYRRAFGKILAGAPLSPEEQRGTALAVGVDGTGGYALPYPVDPTLIHIGAHTTINPFRATCRVEQIVGTDTWRGITATAVTATRTTEAAAATEQGPTFAQPEVIVQRVQAVVTFSIEMGQDRPDIAAEMASLFAEAKDTEEESTFATSTSGTIGMLAAHGTSGMYTHVDTTGQNALAATDLYAVEAALPIRHRMNAQWYMGRATIRAYQALETTGGQLFGGINYAATPYPLNRPSGNTGLTLLGYPLNEVPSAPTTLTDNYIIGGLVNPQTFLIVDRVGMNVELIPHFLDATTGLPTGQRMVYAIWRNAAKPINTDGGRLLAVL